ncbi:hypothetical protein KY289_013451 [Solanum tuberosum]|nr:hypothetical protein KY289_013451 [Solanum tuberosum]
MHMDMNCQEDLEALTSEVEEGWKHVEKKKGKGDNNEKETNQEMMDLTIDHNDVNENKDHKQEKEQNTLFFNKSTRSDKDRQSKTNERQKDKSERHHHNPRVRKARKEVQPYLENIERKFEATKRMFKGKVHIPEEVNLEGSVQGSRSEAEQSWPHLILAKMDHPPNLNNQKVDLGEGDVNNSQERNYATGEGHNLDMFMKCQDDDLTRSFSDDESNRGNRLSKLEDPMKMGKHEQHSIFIFINLSPRNNQNIGDSQFYNRTTKDSPEETQNLQNSTPKVSVG